MTSSALNQVTNLATVQRNLRTVNNNVDNTTTLVKNNSYILTNIDNKIPIIKSTVDNLTNLTKLNQPYYDYTINTDDSKNLSISTKVCKQTDTGTTPNTTVTPKIYYKGYQLLLNTTGTRDIKINGNIVAVLYKLKTSNTDTILDNVYIVDIALSNTKYFIELGDFDNDQLNAAHFLGVVPNSRYIKTYIYSSNPDIILYKSFKGCVGYNALDQPIIMSDTDDEFDNSVFFTLENHPEIQIYNLIN